MNFLTFNLESNRYYFVFNFWEGKFIEKIDQRQREQMIERLNIEHIDYSEVLEEAINNDESPHEEVKEAVINCIKTNKNIIDLIDKLNEKEK